MSRVSDALQMANVAQLVRAPACGAGGRGFESRHSPQTHPHEGSEGPEPAALTASWLSKPRKLGTR